MRSFEPLFADEYATRLTLLKKPWEYSHSHGFYHHLNSLSSSCSLIILIAKRTSSSWTKLSPSILKQMFNSIHSAFIITSSIKRIFTILKKTISETGDAGLKVICYMLYRSIYLTYIIIVGIKNYSRIKERI